MEGSWWGRSAHAESSPTFPLASVHEPLPTTSNTDNMGPKSKGENTKKAAGNAKKAEVAAQKDAAANAKKAADESKQWEKGAKDTSKA